MGKAKTPGGVLKTRPTRVFALGPEGTFSDQAARLLWNRQGEGVPPIEYTRTIPEVLSRTEAEGRALGVIPIENSVAGTVAQAQDGMVTHRLTILWEINLAVRFSLLANAPLGDVETYYSHPQAFDQCSEYLAAHLSQGRVVFTDSNIASERHLRDHGASPPAAAIVPVEVGAAHPELLVAEEIQDFPNNTTRFLVVRRAAAKERFDFSRRKTSLLIEPHEDYPGLLYELLSVFQMHRLNLCRLESRPAKVTPWAYVFYIDCNNNEASAACLADLRRTRNKITVLGSYDLLE